MARSTFGGGASDYVASLYNYGSQQLESRVPNASVALWTDDPANGGTQATDLLVGGAAATSVQADANGNIGEFQGPDGLVELWASADGGQTGRFLYAAPTDGNVAAWVKDPATQTGGAASATFGIPYYPRGPRLAAIGDSVIAAGDGLSEQQFSNSLQHMLAAQSGGRLTLVRNAGVSGNTTGQMLARFDTDVTPWQPDVVWVRGGINDIANGIADATLQANIVSLVGKCQSIGAVPVLDTVSPVDYADSAENARIISFNQWLLGWCRDHCVRCGNSWAYANGGRLTWPDSSYTQDGLHPVTKGQLVIVQAMLAAINDLPTWPPRYAQHETTANEYGPANNLFNTYTGTNGLADGWIAASGNPPSTAFSRVTDASVPGMMQRIAVNETSATQASIGREFSVVEGTDYTAGDRIRVSCVMNMHRADTAAGNVIRGTLHALPWGPSNPGWDAGAYFAEFDADHLEMDIEFTARAGDTVWHVDLMVDTAASSGSTSGNGHVDFGAVKFTNLTKQGLAPNMA